MKRVDVFEINAACDLKISRLSKGMSIEGQGYLHMKIELAFLKNH